MAGNHPNMAGKNTLQCDNNKSTKNVLNIV